MALSRQTKQVSKKGKAIVEKQCAHRFVSTGKKGKWTVKVKVGHHLDRAADETVSTTVFRCENCGAAKEYPDSWDERFVRPDE